MSDASAAAQPGHVTGFGTKGYRTYVLLALMLVYTLNFIDRTVITVVAQPIIDEFGLTDAQWGLLTGPPFALFYALMGIPIAMWADRSNRTVIIALCIIIWSLMTVFCGIASGFIWLLVFRVGVAIGEAGCTPPANSIITDYFPPTSRANAIGIYSMGVTLGGVLAQLFGGMIVGLDGSQFGAWLESMNLAALFGNLDWQPEDGWRVAFILIGAPGILVALLMLFTVKEPPRGYSDPPSTSVETAGFFEAFKEFGRKPTFWTMSVGAAFVAFVGYGLISFQSAFLVRVHGLTPGDAAIYYGAPLAAVAAGGTFLGGFLTERLTPRFPTVVAWLPGVGLLISIPAYVGAFFSPALSMAFALWVVAAIAHYAYLGAQYSIGTGIVSPRSRATTISVALLIISLIGNGIGPLFTGWVSTMSMKTLLSNQGIAVEIADFQPKLCGSGIEALGEYGPQMCQAYADGLKWSMAATTLFLIIAATFYFLASRTYLRDRYNPAAPAIAEAAGI